MLTKQMRPIECPKCYVPQATQGERCLGCGHAFSFVDGRFLLLRHLAQGGFGDIHLAQDREKQRQVVVKTVRTGKASKNPNALARFHREIKATRELSGLSSHVVQWIHDGEDEALGTYYVMEYLQGQTVQELISQGEPLPLERVLHIVKQLCDVLFEAHKHDIIHRDLKPANLFLTRKGKDTDFVKLLDFGLAKDLNSKVGITVGVLGSPRYMAPEQALNDTVDPRTDVYSLALVMYELLTGTQAMPGKTVDQVLMAQLNDDPAPFVLACPERLFPEGLEQALFRALRKAPQERYQDVQSFWAHLAPYVPIGTSPQHTPSTEWEETLDDTVHQLETLEFPQKASKRQSWLGKLWPFYSSSSSSSMT